MDIIGSPRLSSNPPGPNWLIVIGLSETMEQYSLEEVWKVLDDPASASVVVVVVVPHLLVKVVEFCDVTTL